MNSAPRHSLHGRRLLGIGLCLLISLVAAVASTRSISLFPPGVKPKEMAVAGASAHYVLDMPEKRIGDGRTTNADVDALARRLVLLTNVLTSRTGLEYLGKHAHIDPNAISGVTRVTANVPTVLTEPDSERRAAAMAGETKLYRIEVQPHQRLPAFNIYTQAPSVPEAQRLAMAAGPALQDYLRDLAAQDHQSLVDAPQLTLVGSVGGAIVGDGKKITMGLTFMLTLALSLSLLLAVSRVRSRRRRAPEDGEAAPPLAPVAAAAGYGMLRLAPPGPDVTVGPGGAAVLAPSLRLPGLRRARSRVHPILRDWPRTTRLLPWMIAGMMVVIWVVPFNSIELQASLPIDLKFDRLILPFIVGVWALALAAGGPGAPKLRMTSIHAALGACLALACLSLILDAGYLSRLMELQVGIKKLTLLGSYACLFVVVASSVRPGEVPAFMKLMLGLAVICAFGTIWEYRFHFNVFYWIFEKGLPGFFSVANQSESSAVDDIGRRLVRGPAEIPLETVAMMVMALPIALVGAIQANVRRDRILYSLAACLLLAAMISTARKSAFMAPVAVVLTLAYFRRRELMRLAPVALILVIAIHVLSPGAIGAIAFQLDSSRLGVNTVSDRTSDYDAIRPDVFTHLAFGRGYGTYEHTTYRILDMEMTDQLVEVGAFGVAAFILLIISVIAVARGPIRARRPRDSPVALAVAAAAVAFFVMSNLFDSMSFPHVPYIFLTLAGLLVVSVSEEPERPPAWSS